MVNLFSYRALPTITPKSPEFSNFTNDNKSEIEPTPPEAITGISVTSSMLFMKKNSRSTKRIMYCHQRD